MLDGMGGSGYFFPGLPDASGMSCMQRSRPYVVGLPQKASQHVDSDVPSKTSAFLKTGTHLSQRNTPGTQRGERCPGESQSAV